MLEAVAMLSGKHFDWATFNCGLAAADIAMAYCDKDYAEKFRPLCQGHLSAARIVKKAGGMINLMDSLGFESIPVSLARRCDCVLSSGKLASFGIVYDGLRAVFPTKFGLGYINVLECQKAWRVK
jgi:hypothetical protein